MRDAHSMYHLTLGDQDLHSPPSPFIVGAMLLLLMTLRWPSSKTSAPNAADLGSISAFRKGLFPGPMIPVT